MFTSRREAARSALGSGGSKLDRPGPWRWARSVVARGLSFGSARAGRRVALGRPRLPPSPAALGPVARSRARTTSPTRSAGVPGRVRRATPGSAGPAGRRPAGRAGLAQAVPRALPRLASGPSAGLPSDWTQQPPRTGLVSTPTRPPGLSPLTTRGRPPGGSGAEVAPPVEGNYLRLSGLHHRRSALVGRSGVNSSAVRELSVCRHGRAAPDHSFPAGAVTRLSGGQSYGALRSVPARACLYRGGSRVRDTSDLGRPVGPPLCLEGRGPSWPLYGAACYARAHVAPGDSSVVGRDSHAASGCRGARGGRSAGAT